MKSGAWFGARSRYRRERGGGGREVKRLLDTWGVPIP
jgi:hypothetical protein